MHDITSGIVRLQTTATEFSFFYTNAGPEMHSFLKPLNDKLNFVTPADDFRRSLH
jgi:hypothetical protein